MFCKDDKDFVIVRLKIEIAITDNRTFQNSNYALAYQFCRNSRVRAAFLFSIRCRKVDVSRISSPQSQAVCHVE